MLLEVVVGSYIPGGPCATQGGGQSSFVGCKSPLLTPHSLELGCYSPTEAEHPLRAWESRAECCPRLGIKGKRKPHPGARINSRAEKPGLGLFPQNNGPAIRAGAALSPADSCH